MQRRGVLGMALIRKIAMTSVKNWLGAVAVALLAMVGSVHAVETVTYYYTSPQGTVLATADAAGNVLSTADYRPYGAQVLGTPEAGPGYTGHVGDPDSGLVYMQARYYDPMTGRFFGVDPKPMSPGSPFMFGRYSYANNRPTVMVDPDGRVAQLYWSAHNQVTYVVLYNLDESRAQLPVSATQIQAAVHDAFSGTVNFNGVNVTVDAQALQTNGSGNLGAENTIRVVPDTQGVTGTGRSETDGPGGGIGGNMITVGAGGKSRAQQNTFAHELGGHAGGAEDLYKGGLGLDGKVRSADAPGASGIMYNARGQASDESMRQILTAPTSTNICAPGVHAANGGC